MNQQLNNDQDVDLSPLVKEHDIIYASSEPVKTASKSSYKKIKFLVGSVKPLRSISRIKSLNKKTSILPEKSVTPIK